MIPVEQQRTTEPVTAGERPKSRYPSYAFFGAKLTPMTPEENLDVVKAHIEDRHQVVIAAQNMHGLWVYFRNEGMRLLQQRADTYVQIDGMPLLLLSPLFGIPASPRNRVTCVEWIWPLLELAATERWRVFYVGSSQQILTDAIRVATARFPRLSIIGHQGFFDDSTGSPEQEQILEEIAVFKPQLILVGMGFGRQEEWVLAHLDRLGPACICTIGACMEYVAGYVRTPPRWMGRLGLEWLFRLFENPRRFWRRYLIEPWEVIGHMVQYALANRR